MRKIIGLLAGLIAAVSLQAAPVPEARNLSPEPKRFGDYEVHFSAFNSTFVSPEIAGVYKLQRGPRNGIVNIAVRNVKGSEIGKATTATVEGESVNLLSQSSKLKFREVREGDAIYYLAGFRFSNEEMLKFTIRLKPNGEGRTESFEFRRQFYED
ncbi:MAG: DUF4426 domain-containing protein [Endozoicomonas sp.]